MYAAQSRRRFLGFFLSVSCGLLGALLVLHLAGITQSVVETMQLGSYSAAVDCSIERAQVKPITSSQANLSTALASFPRSGNTWVRTLVEKATGYSTSSLYCDKHLRKTFKSECNRQTKFLVKTHYPVNFISHTPDPQKHFHRFHRVVHLVRNPFDAIVSYHNFRGSFNHTLKLHTFSIEPSNLDWYIRKYLSHFLYWSNVPLRTLFIRYEDLRMNSARTLRDIVDFLLDDAGFEDTSLYSLLSTDTSPNHHRQPQVSDEMIKCAVDDGHLAYKPSTKNERFLYSLSYFTRDQVETIVKRLRYPICRSGYRELFPGWIGAVQVNNNNNNDDGSSGDKYAGILQALSELDCYNLTTVVDYEDPPSKYTRLEQM